MQRPRPDLRGPRALDLLGRHRHGAGDRGGCGARGDRRRAADRPRHARGPAPRRGALVRVVLVLVGEEVSPRDRDHFLAFGIDEEINRAPAAPPRSAPPSRAAGGFGFAAHPSRAARRFSSGPAHAVRDSSATAWTASSSGASSTTPASAFAGSATARAHGPRPSRAIDGPPARQPARVGPALPLTPRRRHRRPRRAPVRHARRWPRAMRLMAYKRSFRHLHTHVLCDASRTRARARPRPGLRRPARGPLLHRRRLARPGARLHLRGRRSPDGLRAAGRPGHAGGENPARTAALRLIKDGEADRVDGRRRALARGERAGRLSAWRRTSTPMAGTAPGSCRTRSI